jgi:transaldolase/glucose-6-phosphate isomerase
VVKPDAVEQDEAGAKAVLAELEKQGISLKEITDELVKEGVKSFADSFDKLLGVVAQRRVHLKDVGAERDGLVKAAGAAQR